jgi:hypothetical protein
MDVAPDNLRRLAERAWIRAIRPWPGM